MARKKKFAPRPPLPFGSRCYRCKCLLGDYSRKHAENWDGPGLHVGACCVYNDIFPDGHPLGGGPAMHGVGDCDAVDDDGVRISDKCENCFSAEGLS